jgi:hypothetical protein
MTATSTRKIRACSGCILGVIGFLLVMGSFVWLAAGPEPFKVAYEYVTGPNGWVLLCLLAGMCIFVAGLYLLRPDVPVTGPVSGPAPGGAPQGKALCAKCRALNDERAKFCNQCGAAL